MVSEAQQTLSARSKPIEGTRCLALTWLESRNGREKNEAVVQIASDSIRLRKVDFLYIGGFGFSCVSVVRCGGVTISDSQGFELQWFC